MPLACCYCIVTKGLKGFEVWSLLPQTDEELYTHIESEHHITVRREGETTEAARERFRLAYPEASNPATCKCPACQHTREMERQLGLGRV